MIKKRDIISQKENHVLVENHAFFSEFDTYEIAVHEKQFHQFQFSKQIDGRIYTSLMTAEEVMHMRGATYFTQLINSIQSEAV